MQFESCWLCRCAARWLSSEGSLRKIWYFSYSSERLCCLYPQLSTWNEKRCNPPAPTNHPPAPCCTSNALHDRPLYLCQPCVCVCVCESFCMGIFNIKHDKPLLWSMVMGNVTSATPSKPSEFNIKNQISHSGLNGRHTYTHTHTCKNTHKYTNTSLKVYIDDGVAAARHTWRRYKLRWTRNTHTHTHTHMHTQKERHRWEAVHARLWTKVLISSKA